MRVVLFSDTFPPEINGVATSTYNLFQALLKEGHEAFVVCTNPYSNRVQFHDRILRIPGLELKKLYSYRIANFYNSRAMRMISAMKPDIIHVQTDAGLGLFGRIAAKKLKIPLVYTYHTMYEDYTYYVTKGKGLFDRFAKGVVRKVSCRLAEKTTEFISPSNKTKEIMRNYGVSSYINVVPTGIDFSKYEKSNINMKKLEDLREQYNLKGYFVILSLGRIAKEKSIDVCIKGFAELLKKKKSTKFKMLIVGGGPDLADLQALVQELNINDNVVFVGPVPAEEVQYYYHLADLFVSASLTETQGLTFMEAMAARIPLMARFDDNLEDVIIDRKTGYYFENENDFASKVMEIISLSPNKKEELLNDAFHIINQYSIETFYHNIMEVYARALRKYW